MKEKKNQCAIMFVWRYFALVIVQKECRICFFKRRLESPNCAYFAELKIPRNGFIDFQ